MTQSSRKADRTTVRRIAVAVPCDPRSVDGVLEGRRTTLAVRGGVLRALRELGLEHLLPANEVDRRAS